MSRIFQKILDFGKLLLLLLTVSLIQSIQCRNSDNKFLETTPICSHFHLDLQIFSTFSVFQWKDRVSLTPRLYLPLFLVFQEQKTELLRICASDDVECLQYHLRAAHGYAPSAGPLPSYAHLGCDPKKDPNCKPKLVQKGPSGLYVQYPNCDPIRDPLCAYAASLVVSLILTAACFLLLFYPDYHSLLFTCSSRHPVLLTLLPLLALDPATPFSKKAATPLPPPNLPLPLSPTEARTKRRLLPFVLLLLLSRTTTPTPCSGMLMLMLMLTGLLIPMPCTAKLAPQLPLQQQIRTPCCADTCPRLK